MRKTWIKCVCAVLCVLSLTAGAFLGSFALWVCVDGHDGFYQSSLCTNMMHNHAISLERTMALARMTDTGRITTISSDEREYLLETLDEDMDALRAENTNFLYLVLDPDGNFYKGNVSSSAELRQKTGRSGDFYFDPTGEYFFYWATDQEARVNYHAMYGVADPLSADDDLMAAQRSFESRYSAAPAALALGAGALLLGLALLVLLMCAAGRRPGREEAVRNLLDRIPYELCLAAGIALVIPCVVGYQDGFNDWLFWEAGSLWMALCLLCCFGMALAFTVLLLTTATRIKTRTIFRNTIIWRLCRLIGRLFRWLYRAVKRAILALPIVWRTVVLFLIYLLGTVLTGLTIFLIPIYQGFVLFLACRWALQWRRIRQATGAIVAGQTDVQIDNRKFFPDLKEHAGQLNDLGSAIDHAVDDRLKSERFKAELITNVSHDLKTPLTSIINYVDLLKKENIDNPRAAEYIEVLERKSQRLKKLTEDLVEASKASSGTLTVVKERLDMVQLAEQAAGEYEERLTAAGLTLVKRLPDAPLYIHADGRHVWRILDNLLGNCAKYALEGTRVYLDAAGQDGNFLLVVRNVSRQPLNVPPEQLMERFVRGDEARTTEGSGLGLSIARSLTELQGGRFSLAIDGDLFKAIVVFPLLTE